MRKLLGWTASVCWLGEPEQVNVVAGCFVERAGAIVAREYRKRDQLTLVFPRPCLGMRDQGFADALTLVARQDREVGDMAIGATGKEILRLLQVDEPDSLTIVVFSHENKAVGRLFVQLPGEVFADALDALMPFTPGGQGEIDEAGNEAEDELIIILGESNEEMVIAHASASGLHR